MKRWWSSILAVVSLAAGGAAFIAQAPDVYASALLTCTGTNVATFDPGLTNRSQQTNVTVSESYAPCVVPNTGITSGDNTPFTVTVDANCLANFVQVPTSVTYTWNTGQTSVVQFSTNDIVRLADGSTQVTSVGSVTSGFDANATATRVVVLPQPNPVLCLTPSGVTRLTGTATLAFASL